MVPYARLLGVLCMAHLYLKIITKLCIVQSCDDLGDADWSVKRSSPLGVESGWKCADLGLVLPSSQNSISPSAFRVPFLTRWPLSRMRSSMVRDLSENILSYLAFEVELARVWRTFRWSLIKCLFLQSGHVIKTVPWW